MVLFLLNLAILGAFRAANDDPFKTHRISLTHQNMLVRNHASPLMNADWVLNFFVKMRIVRSSYLLRTDKQYLYTCTLDG